MRRLLRWLLPALVACVAHAAPADDDAPPVDPLRAAGDRVIAALRADDLKAIEQRFDARMTSLYPHQRFLDTWSTVRQQAGAMATCDEPKREPVDGFTSLDYTCRFEKASVLVRVALDDRARVAGLLLKPLDTTAPATPALFESAWPTETLDAGASGWPLPATLTLAPDARKAPAVVLVHDFGKHDRDETTGVNKPFRDLAEGLAARGIVSLRYEKRTLAFEKRIADEKIAWTLDDEVVDDAVAALALLAARPEAGPLYVVGLGYGGRLAPRIVERAKAKGVVVAGIVMLAPSYVPVADQLYSEVEFLSQLAVPTVTAKAVQEMGERRDNVKALVAPPPADTPKEPAAAKAEAPPKPATKPAKPAAPEPAPPAEPPRATGLPFDLPASAWRDIATYDPAATLLAQPELPALLIFGGRDFQVPSREMRPWQRKLQGRPGTTIVEFPGVNHVMMEGRGALAPSDYAHVARVSQDVIDRIATWIRTAR